MTVKTLLNHCMTVDGSSQIRLYGQNMFYDMTVKHLPPFVQNLSIRGFACEGDRLNIVLLYERELLPAISAYNDWFAFELEYKHWRKSIDVEV